MKIILNLLSISILRRLNLRITHFGLDCLRREELRLDRDSIRAQDVVRRLPCLALNSFSQVSCVRQVPYRFLKGL